MCGLAGCFYGVAKDQEGLHAELARMIDTITHRGPDDSGIWVDPEIGIGLGFRRLSILDLSRQGHQPMSSVSGRYVIVFNGEIYNHSALRDELERLAGASSARKEMARWRGHSDTEVMLAAIEHWGVEAALTRFNGMFAFALLDRRERILHLARDRFGEKPLYYGWMGGVLLFGSDLSALRASPAWRGEIDRDALALYMRHTYIPAPFSIYKNIRKLPPAHVLSIPLAGAKGKAAVSRPYWHFRKIVESCVRRPFSGAATEAIEGLHELLLDAVKIRMEADVPLGAFLSGGVDSSTIVALMQAQSSRPVKTFSIGFHEQDYNEAEYAKAIAKHLNTDHTELYVTASESMDVIPRLPEIYSEPFADSSQIPTFLISSMTRQHVTVALSGDGGDELFGGYGRYFLVDTIWRRLRWLPRSARMAMARVLMALPFHMVNRVFSVMGARLPGGSQLRLTRDNIHKISEVLACASLEDQYQRIVSYWRPETVVQGASPPLTALTDSRQWADVPDALSRMMFLDMMSYLPDDILAKVDRASMAASLEVRVPLLDPRVVEFAWGLPLSMKIHRRQGKWALRQVLYKYVPRQLIDRPKMGFGVPIAMWLRGPLRQWAEALLDESCLKQEGLFNHAVLRKTWDAYLGGEQKLAHRLWPVLMFQAWLELQKV